MFAVRFRPGTSVSLPPSARQTPMRFGDEDAHRYVVIRYCMLSKFPNVKVYQSPCLNQSEAEVSLFYKSFIISLLSYFCVSLFFIYSYYTVSHWIPFFFSVLYCNFLFCRSSLGSSDSHSSVARSEDYSQDYVAEEDETVICKCCFLIIWQN